MHSPTLSPPKASPQADLPFALNTAPTSPAIGSLLPFNGNKTKGGVPDVQLANDTRSFPRNGSHDNSYPTSFGRSSTVDLDPFSPSSPLTVENNTISEDNVFGPVAPIPTLSGSTSQDIGHDYQSWMGIGDMESLMPSFAPIFDLTPDVSSLNESSFSGVTETGPISSSNAPQCPSSVLINWLQTTYQPMFNLPTAMQPIPVVQANIQSVFIDKKHHCLWPSGCIRNFTRMSDLERHWYSVHLGQKHHCTWFGCSDNQGRGFCRIEKLRKHQKDCHGFSLV